jgi:hypothetical protein
MLKELNKDELLALFDESVRDALEAQMRKPGVEAVVIFECVQMDSSSFGNRTALIVGDPYTFKSVEACEGKWIKDLPSQREYAQSFYRVPKGECGGAVR